MNASAIFSVPPPASGNGSTLENASGRGSVQGQFGVAMRTVQPSGVKEGNRAARTSSGLKDPPDKSEQHGKTKQHTGPESPRALAAPVVAPTSPRMIHGESNALRSAPQVRRTDLTGDQPVVPTGLQHGQILSRTDIPKNALPAGSDARQQGMSVSPCVPSERIVNAQTTPASDPTVAKPLTEDNNQVLVHDSGSTVAESKPPVHREANLSASQTPDKDVLRLTRALPVIVHGLAKSDSRELMSSGSADVVTAETAGGETEPATPAADAIVHRGQLALTSARTALPKTTGRMLAIVDFEGAGKSPRQVFSQWSATLGPVTLQPPTGSTSTPQVVQPPVNLFAHGALGSPQLTQAIAQHVAWLIGNGVQQATIQVSPPHLGPISVQVANHHNVVDVSFTAQSAFTSQALRQSLPQLTQMLTQQGLNMGQATVGQQGSGSQHTWQGEPANRVAATHTPNSVTAHGSIRHPMPQGQVDDFV